MNDTQQKLFDDAMAIVESDRPELAKLIRQYPVKWDNTNADAAATWVRGSNKYFSFNPSYSATEPIDLANLLIHEATHAADDLAGRLIDYGTNWGINEIHAYEESSKHWAEHFPDGKYPEVDELDKINNKRLQMYRNHTLWDWVHREYNPYRNPFF